MWPLQGWGFAHRVTQGRHFKDTDVRYLNLWRWGSKGGTYVGTLALLHIVQPGFLQSTATVFMANCVLKYTKNMNMGKSDFKMRTLPVIETAIGKSTACSDLW